MSCTCALTCAYTHVAAQNISVEGCPGGTLHHCLHKYPAWSGVVIIDEVSQIPLPVWAVIQRWLISGSTFVCLGDFRSQFGAAYNRWRQTEVSANVENLLFFRRLCGFNRVNFVKYRRGTDNSFFKL